MVVYLRSRADPPRTGKCGSNARKRAAIPRRWVNTWQPGTDAGVGRVVSLQSSAVSLREEGLVLLPAQVSGPPVVFFARMGMLTSPGRLASY